MTRESSVNSAAKRAVRFGESTDRGLFAKDTFCRSAVIKPQRISALSKKRVTAYITAVTRVVPRRLSSLLQEMSAAFIYEN